MIKCGLLLLAMALIITANGFDHKAGEIGNWGGVCSLTAGIILGMLSPWRLGRLLPEATSSRVAEAKD